MDGMESFGISFVVNVNCVIQMQMQMLCNMEVSKKINQ